MKPFSNIPYLLILLLCTGTPSFGRSEKALKKDGVPKAVLAAFKKAYPRATANGYSWEADAGNIEYEIQSTEGAIRRDISFRPDGGIISVEERVSHADLPSAVREALGRDYPGWKIVICERVIEGSTISYEMHMRSGKQKLEVAYTPGGAVLRTEKQ